MLSPHEFAALMLVNDAPGPFGLDPENLDVLLKHRLVALQTLPSGQQRLHLTSGGVSVLRAVTRVGS
ncbi:hypothetical protein P0D80_47680 [Paraburkholderia sp. RL17-373-BIF-A]